jgi:hypothetical protein
VTENNQGVDDFFDNTGGGGPLPSAVLKKPGDFVYGEVVDQFKVDKIKFGTKDVIERDSKTGEPIKQLVVVLQTDHRNWENVVKVPLADKDDPNSGDLDPAQDQGRRAIYVAPWTNIHAAIGDAIVATTGKKQGLAVGSKLGVKITELKDTGKGNPLKIHAAKYEVPAPSSDFFGESKTAGGSGDASASQPEPAKSEPAPASQDPWGSNSPSEPPF